MTIIVVIAVAITATRRNINHQNFFKPGLRLSRPDEDNLSISSLFKLENRFSLASYSRIEVFYFFGE